jgi:nicotinate-nucleotide adenylyltransferase
VMERSGWPVMTTSELESLLNLPVNVKLSLQRINVPLIDLASRDIRRRVCDGKSIRFMMPREVEEYIKENKLYGSTK